MNIKEKIEQYKQLGSELNQFKQLNFFVGNKVLHIPTGHVGTVAKCPSSLTIELLHNPAELSAEGIWVEFREEEGPIFVGLENISKQ